MSAFDIAACIVWLAGIIPAYFVLKSVLVDEHRAPFDYGLSALLAVLWPVPLGAAAMTLACWAVGKCLRLLERHP